MDLCGPALHYSSASASSAPDIQQTSFAEGGRTVYFGDIEKNSTFYGDLAGPDDFPHFWIICGVSPFTYLVDGMMSTGWANAAATRSDVEI